MADTSYVFARMHICMAVHMRARANKSRLASCNQARYLSQISPFYLGLPAKCCRTRLTMRRQKAGVTCRWRKKTRAFKEDLCRQSTQRIGIAEDGWRGHGRLLICFADYLSKSRRVHVLYIHVIQIRINAIIYAASIHFSSTSNIILLIPFCNLCFAATATLT